MFQRSVNSSLGLGEENFRLDGKKRKSGGYRSTSDENSKDMAIDKKTISPRATHRVTV